MIKGKSCSVRAALFLLLVYKDTQEALTSMVATMNPTCGVERNLKV